MRHLPVLAILACAAVLPLGGCNADSAASALQSLSLQEQGVQQSTVANLAMNQVIESTTQTLVDEDTGNATTLEVTPRAAPRAAGSRTVDLATMTRPDGTRLFPNASGQFTVTTDGAVVSSWPTASNVSTTRTVTITFSSTNPVTVTDPSSGTSVSISAGTVTMDWTSSYVFTSVGNWVLNLDVVTTISPAVSATTTRGGASTVSTIAGKRRAQTTMTRTTTTVAPVTNTLAVRRVLSGDAANPKGESTSNLTDWTVTGTVSGLATTMRWNRAADFTETWTMTSGARTATTSIATDVIYITYNNAFTFGPYTSAQVAALFQTTAQNTMAY
jgi:hypothetical protein